MDNDYVVETVEFVKLVQKAFSNYFNANKNPNEVVAVTNLEKTFWNLDSQYISMVFELLRSYGTPEELGYRENVPGNMLLINPIVLKVIAISIKMIGDRKYSGANETAEIKRAVKEEILK